MQDQHTAFSAKSNGPTVHGAFEKVTGSWQYVVADEATHEAVIIDPVLNFDPTDARIWTESADQLLDIVDGNCYRVGMILETHVHADHITAASYLQQTIGKKQGRKVKIGIGGRIGQIQKMFGQRYGIPDKEYTTAFDKQWEDDEMFKIGNLDAQAIHLPGHTPDHMGYKIGDDIFVGDSVFHMDIGSARADFPGGNAQAIFESGRRLFSFPDHTRIWSGHDYPPEGREAPQSVATVKQHREGNKHLSSSKAKKDFVEMRQKRDETLAAPRLMHPSLQINIRAGHLPEPTASGARMLYLPLKIDAPW